MKIGILTLPLNTNYGGILQAYALQTILKRMGCEVNVIEKKKRPLSLSIQEKPICYGKRIVKNLIGRKCPIFYEQKFNREQPIIQKNTDKFIHKYIHLITYNNFSEIKESEYDAIIVGSDQIWRPKYFRIDKIENAYLKFAEGWNIKRIAYAASFGTDKWEYTKKQTDECGRLLKKFDAVSVRETSGIDLCKDKFGVEAQHVLDPTMLLTKEDYIKLFEADNTPKSKGNLLCYILDETEEKKTLIKRIADEKGLIPFNVKSRSNDINSPISDRIQPPIEQWLRGFYDAEFVVTDSFHACVFSILFNKPFLVVGNADRGISRFTSLLNMFKLRDRLIDNKTFNNITTSISWRDVIVFLENNRKKSRNFLSNNLTIL